MPWEHYRDAPGSKSMYFTVFLDLRVPKARVFIYIYIYISPLFALPNYMTCNLFETQLFQYKFRVVGMLSTAIQPISKDTSRISNPIVRHHRIEQGMYISYGGPKVNIYNIYIYIIFNIYIYICVFLRVTFTSHIAIAIAIAHCPSIPDEKYHFDRGRAITNIPAIRR